GASDDAGSMTRGHREEPGEQGYRDRETSGGRGGSDAGEYLGRPAGGSDDTQIEDTQDRQSATTSYYRPVRGGSRRSSGDDIGGGRDEGMIEGSRGAETTNQDREAYDRTRAEDLPVGDLPISSPEEVERGIPGDRGSGAAEEAERGERGGQRPDREGQRPEDRWQEEPQGEESGITRVWRRINRG
ncbi:MAG: hypothetical protein M3122_07910, partial [Actinomycetota bacterium]|nr:hypothetical protein [Actinomycetota bacterium]